MGRGCKDVVDSVSVMLSMTCRKDNTELPEDRIKCGEDLKRWVLSQRQRLRDQELLKERFELGGIKVLNNVVA